MTGIGTISGRIIAVTGAGGKTSLLFALKDQFCREGKKVIITTTTHMMEERERPSLILSKGRKSIKTEKQMFCSSWEEILSLVPEILSRYGYVIIGEEDPGKPKIRAFHLDNDWIGELSDMCDSLLVEADGARHLPVKAPGSNEPVIPVQADTVVAVAGLSALHKPVRDIAFRPELLSGLLQKEIIDPFEIPDLEKLILSDRGLGKGVEGRRYEVVLNQSDTLPEQDLAEVKALASRLLSCGIPVTVTALKPLKKLRIILLAAGNSVRFGSDKLTEKCPDGKRMYEKMMDTLVTVRNSFCAFEYRSRYNIETAVTVVTQEKYRILSETAVSKGFEVRYNPEPERGIASSLRIGLEGEQDADAFLFTVCDQPHLSSETISRLIIIYLNDHKRIVCASCNGIPGNPCLFSSDFYGELMGLSGDRGGKQIFRNHPEEIVFVETDPQELKDIDLPGDLT